MTSNTNMETNAANGVSKISPRLLLDISATLAGLVSHHLGPTDERTLLTTNTGKAVVTSEGFRLLTALSYSHPVAEVVMKSMKNLYSVTHDGSKTFMVYLSELLRQIDASCEVLGTSDRANMSRKLKKFLQEDFEEIVKRLGKKLHHFHCSESIELVTKMKRVLVTSLRTNLTKSQASFFADILWAALSCRESSSVESILKLLSQLLQDYDCHVIKVSSHSLHSSMVLDGILLDCDMNALKDFKDRIFNKDVNFVLVDLGSHNKEESEQSGVVFAPSSTEAVSESFFLRRSRIAKLLEKLKTVNVELVLTSEKLPPFVLTMFAEQEVTVLQNLESDKVALILKYMGLNILSEFHEGSVGDDYVGRCMCQRVQVGTARQIIFNPSVKQGDSQKLVLKQIVLCSPSESLSEQVSTSLRKALWSLTVCFPASDTRDSQPWFWQTLLHCDLTSEEGTDLSGSSDPSLSAEKSEAKFLVVPGGGTFEALLSAAISEHFKAIRSHPQKSDACELVQKMLRSVPYTLFCNLSPVPSITNRNHLFTQHWMEMLKSRDNFLGFNEYGELVDTEKVGILEPVSTKLRLVYQVIEVVQSLLRLDTVVSVHKPS